VTDSAGTVTLRLMAGEARIKVRLVAAESGAVVWADTLEYPNETQWNGRRDVGTRIANALDIQTKDVLGGWGQIARSRGRRLNIPCTASR
jgi:two-component sensor histidine kinase